METEALGAYDLGPTRLVADAEAGVRDSTRARGCWTSLRSTRPRRAAWRRAVLGALALAFIDVPLASAQPPPTGQAPAPGPAFEIQPRAYVQFDWRGYPDWTVPLGTGRLTYDALEVRRARVGVDGRWRRVSFEFSFGPEDLEDVWVKDAYLQVRVNRAVGVRAGQFKLPGSREYGTSARSIDFLERSALAESTAPHRDIGVMLTGRVGARIEYEAGLFAGDGNGRRSRADRTAAGRVVWDLPENVEVAFALSEGRVASEDTEPANGFTGRSSSGYRFFEPVYVQGRRGRIGADAAWDPGPWRFAVEALRAVDARDRQGLDYEDLPSLVGVGWSVAATRRFGLRQGGPRSRLREWDLGVRYDRLSFDDEGPETPRDSVRARATDVRARAVRTVTSAVSWRPASWVRAMGNASIERYSEARSAPEAGRRGGYWMFAASLQVEWP